MPRFKNLIFDMDDTLLVCSLYYVQCKDRFIQYSHDRTGISSDIIRHILNSIDVACTGLNNGFGKERFPRSFAATSAVLDMIQGNLVDDHAAEYSYFIGSSVFHAEYSLYPNVFDRLLDLRNSGYNLFLCTKGDYDIQLRKIINNGLDTVFQMDRVYIVPKKTKTELTRIVQDHNLDLETTVMIGDSMRDDIGSANLAGLNSIWVQNSGKQLWDYEDTDHIPDYTVNMITDDKFLDIITGRY